MRVWVAEKMMKPLHVLAALLVAVVWGFNFVVIRIGIDSYPPLMLAALRFTVSAVPVLFLAKPGIGWGRIIAVGAFWFLAQFGFLFVAIKIGMPPGLASVVIQSQALFTITLSSIFLGEHLNPLQIAGAFLAFAGLGCVGASMFQGYTMDPSIGFLMVLTAGLGWAIGNIVIRSGPKTEMLNTVAWVSLVPPIPLISLSFALERPDALNALTHFSMSGIASVFYLGFVATTFGYGVWGYLLNLYPAGIVSQFAIAVPIFGITSSALVFGERFGPWEIVGILFVIAGLTLNAFAAPRFLSSPVDKTSG
jgi:O-acetylserine/cysteine efflux transporter